MLSNQEGNDKIIDFIDSGKPFMVGRVGLTEIFTSYMYDNGVLLTPYNKQMLSNNAGVYGDCYDEFHKRYLKAIASSDIQIMWDIESLLEAQKNVYGKYCPDSTIVSNRTVEPFYFDNPWSNHLKGKKVLVISPFTESIIKQYPNRDKIWVDKDILPTFELSTYKNIQSIGGIGPHNNWVESLEFMEEGIGKLDFDIAILGCGAYGMPLSDYIKNKMGKSAIYVGGGLQLMFGISGKRWDNHEVIRKYYNNSWVRPHNTETPSKSETVEGGCYW